VLVFFGSNVPGPGFGSSVPGVGRGLVKMVDTDRQMIHLLRANGDLLPEVGGDTITFELEYTGENNGGRVPEKARSTYGAIGNARLIASLKFARRTDITESQAAPVLDEFIAEVRAWFAETFKLEPAA